MKVGVEKLKALFKVIEKVGVTEQKIMADGKISYDDIGPAIALISGIQEDIKAIKEIKGALEEAKDLDQAEVVELLQEGYRVVKAIEDADK